MHITHLTDCFNLLYYYMSQTSSSIFIEKSSINPVIKFPVFIMLQIQKIVVLQWIYKGNFI